MGAGNSGALGVRRCCMPTRGNGGAGGGGGGGRVGDIVSERRRRGDLEVLGAGKPMMSSRMGIMM